MSLHHQSDCIFSTMRKSRLSMADLALPEMSALTCLHLPSRRKTSSHPLHTSLFSCILSFNWAMRKAKQMFFTFTFDNVVEDVTYLLERYFPETPLPELRMLNKRTILKQRQRILKLFGYRLCTPTDRHDVFLRAQQAARISSKPIYVLRELLHYLTEQ